MVPGATLPRPEGAPLHRAVQELVLGWIREGALGPGDRLPSLRELHRKVGVSVSTVMKAYMELEAQGHLEARPQSGHYVAHAPAAPAPRPRRSAPSTEPTAVDKFRFIYTVLEAQRDPGIVPLGSAVPAEVLLPVRELARLSRLGPTGESLSYGAVEGEPGLRRQVAFGLLDAGARVHPDELIVTGGATEGISLALRAVTRPGDVVAVESPCYFLYLQMLETLGLRAVEVPSDPDTGMVPGALAEALRRHPVRACVLQPNFGNPLGWLYPEDHRRELVRLAAGAGVPIVEDDIYGDLPFGERRPPSLLALDGQGLVLHVSSFSKTVAPGYRVGWVRPGRFHDAVLRLKVSTSLASPRPTQLALEEYLASGRYGRHLRRLRRAFQLQVATCSAQVHRWFPEGTRISRPRGGFVLWVELPGGADALELFRRALPRGIGVAPGPIFTSQDKYRSCLRLNCGHPWSPRIEAAVKTLGELAREV